MRKQRQNQPFQPEDYNEPTEPLEPIVIPQYAGPLYTENGVFPSATTSPAPAPAIPLPPTEVLPPYPYYQQPQPAYPVLPPAPLKKYRGYPPGGAVPRQGRRPAYRRRSMLPGLVRFLLLLVQLVLLARVVCLLFSVQGNTPWLALLFAAGDLFVRPVVWLAANINLSILAGTQFLIYLEFLVAILAYGLLSRLLPFLLRALLD